MMQTIKSVTNIMPKCNENDFNKTINLHQLEVYLHLQPVCTRPRCHVSVETLKKAELAAPAPAAVAAVVAAVLVVELAVVLVVAQLAPVQQLVARGIPCCKESENRKKAAHWQRLCVVESCSLLFRTGETGI